MAELRERFRAATIPRLAVMSALLDRLARDPADAEARRELTRHFHGLAGMGGTHGFPRVSELAEEAEEGRWREVVREIERELR